MNFRLWLEEDEDLRFWHAQSLTDDQMAAPGVTVNGVKFVKPPRAPDDVVVMTDIRKFDEGWSKDQMYISPGGEGESIGDRYEHFKHYLTTGDPVIMSEVSVIYRDIPAFTNGRHRYSVFRDMGWKKIPMSVDPESAPKFRRLYGI